VSRFHLTGATLRVIIDGDDEAEAKAKALAEHVAPT
jgi:hypothetical protein